MQSYSNSKPLFFILSVAQAGQVHLLRSSNFLGWKCKAGNLTYKCSYWVYCHIWYRYQSFSLVKQTTAREVVPRRWSHNTQINTLLICHTGFFNLFFIFWHHTVTWNHSITIVSNRLHRFTATNLVLSRWLTEAWRQAAEMWCPTQWNRGRYEHEKNLEEKEWRIPFILFMLYLCFTDCLCLLICSQSWWQRYSTGHTQESLFKMNAIIF